jgi:hypothetical protein
MVMTDSSPLIRQEIGKGNGDYEKEENNDDGQQSIYWQEIKQDIDVKTVKRKIMNGGSPLI